jgi:hypothetical protein
MSGDGNGNGKNGKSALEFALKAVFGEAPAQWIRFVLLGVGLAVLYYSAQDFKENAEEFRDDMKAESAAVRKALSEYVAANEKWQQLTAEERAKLIDKADRRFRRLYVKNGWEYQGLTE